MIDRLKKMNIAARMKSPDTDHTGVWSATFTDPDLRKWLRNTKRNTRPKVIEYATYTLCYNRVYWATIDEFEEWGKRARMRVECSDDGVIYVRTENIAALTLDLPRSPLASRGEVRIESAAGMMKARTDKPFTVRYAKRDNAPLQKSQSLCGPVREVYRGPFVFVRGSGDAGESE
jgi:hypothetical protein